MTPDVITYADEVEAGSIIGPRIFSTTRGIFAGEDMRSLQDARDIDSPRVSLNPATPAFASAGEIADRCAKIPAADPRPC